MSNRGSAVDSSVFGKARNLPAGGGGQALACHPGMRSFNYVFLCWLTLQRIEDRLAKLMECKADIRAMGERKAMEKWLERMA